MTRYFLFDTDAGVLIRHDRIESIEMADSAKNSYFELTGGHDIRVLKVIDDNMTRDDILRTIRDYKIFGEKSIPKNQTTLFDTSDAPDVTMHRDLPKSVELIVNW